MRNILLSVVTVVALVSLVGCSVWVREPGDHAPPGAIVRSGKQRDSSPNVAEGD